MKLAENILDKLTCPPGRKDRIVADDVQQGLYLRITATGSKSWMVKYTLHGKTTKLPLGSRSALSLKAARPPLLRSWGRGRSGSIRPPSGKSRRRWPAHRQSATA